MTTSPNPIKRVEKVVDLRFFNSVIEKELDKHIPLRFESLLRNDFYPAIFQLLANEITYFNNKYYNPRIYQTRSFNSAYFYQDRCEILDELRSELYEYLSTITGVRYFKYNVKVSFITHNQWILSYVETKHEDNFHSSILSDFDNYPAHGPNG